MTIKNEKIMTIKNEKIMEIKTRGFKNEACARFALFLDAYGIRYENEGKWFKLGGYSYGDRVPGEPCPDGSVVACVEPDEGKWRERSGVLYVSEGHRGFAGNYYGLDGDCYPAHFCDGKEDWDDRCFTLCGDDDNYLGVSDRTRAERARERVGGATAIHLTVEAKGRGESVAAGILVSGRDRYLWVDDESPWPELALVLNNP